jgi:ribosome modulation factor
MPNPIQDRLKDNRDEGFDARMANKHELSCPYVSSSARAAWLRGWRECDQQIKKLKKEGKW